MIAIMTWKEDLNEELKLRLDGSRIMDSIEELEDDLDYLDKVILTRHLDWSLEELRTVLKNLKDSGIEIFYIKESDTPEELSLLIELDVKNILFEPMDVEEIVNKVKNTGLFDDEDYLNGATFISEIDETEEKNEDSSIDKIDVIEDKSIAEIKKSESVVLENVRPVIKAKKENAFVFFLNYIYKILKLFVHAIVNIISSIADIIPWFIGGAIVSVAANYFLKEQGIDSFPKLMELVKEIIQQFTK